MTALLTAQLAGIGHHYPGPPISNDELLRAHPELSTNHDWIVQHTGVETRHWPSSDECHVDMALSAARMALDDAGISPSDIDVLVGSSATVRPSTNPSTTTNRYMDIALPLQARLNASCAYAFDVSGTACASFLYASEIARSLLATTSARHILVVCAENPVPILNFEFKNSVLFGAGAAAAIWTANGQRPGIESLVLGSDGQHYDAFDIDDKDKVIMKGRHVGEFAPRALAEVSSSTLEQVGLDWDDIDWIVPHQGNIHIIHDLAKITNAPPEKILKNIAHRGNVSSVSTPGCLSQYLHDGTIRPGQRVLCMSIGRGFTWGALLLRISKDHTRATERHYEESSLDQV